MTSIRTSGAGSWSSSERAGAARRSPIRPRASTALQRVSGSWRASMSGGTARGSLSRPRVSAAVIRIHQSGSFSRPMVAGTIRGSSNDVATCRAEARTSSSGSREQLDRGLEEVVAEGAPSTRGRGRAPSRRASSRRRCSASPPRGGPACPTRILRTAERVAASPDGHEGQEAVGEGRPLAGGGAGEGRRRGPAGWRTRRAGAARRGGRPSRRGRAGRGRRGPSPGPPSRGRGRAAASGAGSVASIVPGARRGSGRRGGPRARPARRAARAPARGRA